MLYLKTKYLLIVILFAVTIDASFVKEEIYMSLRSKPESLNKDYVSLDVGDSLQLTCEASEKMRGMRVEFIDFDSYDPESKQINITWQDNLEWDKNTFQHNRVYYKENYTYTLFLDIKYIELEHSGWQICFINKNTYRYLYVYVNDRNPSYRNYYDRTLIKTKLKSNLTLPCISPNPNFILDLLYFSYTENKLILDPNKPKYKFNDRIGCQITPIAPFTKYFCCYSHACKVIIVIEEYDEESINDNNLMPMFNKDYSAVTSLGTDLKMECIFINSKEYPISFNWNTPTFSEEKNKTQISNFEIEVMANTTIHISSLIVKNVTINDFGLYKCSVFDFNKKEIGFASRQTFIKAYKKNVIKYFNDTKIPIMENQNCVLLCEASYPITWNYDLSEENKSKPTNVFISSSFNANISAYQSILKIKMAKYQNNGYYYCHEINTWREIENPFDEKKLFVYVLQDAATVDTFPNEKITKIYVQKHSPNVTFPCIPRTTNSSCILYNLYESKIKKVPEYGGNQFTFLIQSVIEDDLNYECYCRVKKLNKSGYEYMENIIELKVYESFHESTLPYINSKYDKNVTIGEELKLNCTILRYCKQCTSNRRLNVNWTFNDNSMNIMQRKSIHEKYIPLYNAELYLSTLVIKNVQKSDSYEYKCSVENLSSKMNVIILDEEILSNYVFISYIIASFIVITIIAITILIIKQVKLQNKIRKVGLSNFNKGVKGIFNPKLYINLQADMLPYDKKLEIPRSKIKIGQQLGSGNFGLVFEGEIFGQFAGETVKTVAIKIVRRNLKYEYMKTLIAELKILSILGKHLNVIELLGACTENLNRMELLVILEYCHYGNIRDILRNNRNNFLDLINTESSDTEQIYYININSKENVRNISETCKYNQQITTNTLINWAYQISAGMEFMALRKVLHGDLAARNILLNENHIVKICDFGLSKNLSINYNYKRKTHCPLPIKWMAIESIRDKTFSTQSDVWSFGIVLWEIFSLAETPYSNLQETVDFLQIINNGYRMEQPMYSTKEIYQIMLECWQHDPKHRPSFSLINNFFDSILEHNFRNHYLELSNEYVAESNQEQNYVVSSF